MPQKAKQEKKNAEKSKKTARLENPAFMLGGKIDKEKKEITSKHILKMLAENGVYVTNIYLKNVVNK